MSAHPVLTSEKNGVTRVSPLRLGTVGLGGYAGHICRLLSQYAVSSMPPVCLEAVCEPNLAAHTGRVAELRGQGVDVCADWAELLARPLEAIWLPLPISLHRPYTEAALAAGKAVLCEKPAAGCVQDLDAMRCARDRADLPLAFGFQDIYEPSTRALKTALLNGDIGPVRSATLSACWPRDSRYYARSAWAGRQKQNGTWVMDSPASNALAHFLNLLLFLLGAEQTVSVVAARVEAELYRANPIENYDTCALRLHTEANIPLLVLLTHACRQTRQPRMEICGERGTLLYTFHEQAVISNRAGARTISLHTPSHTHMVERFAHLVRGTSDARLAATPEVARAHLVAVNGASEASPVRNVPAEFVSVLPSAEGGTLRAIDGIEDLFDRCARTGCLPHETGSVPWSAPAGQRNLHGYRFFAGPAQS